jgi:hypothetical protein
MKNKILMLGMATLLSSFSYAAEKNDRFISVQQHISAMDTKPIKVYSPTLSSIALKMPSKAKVTECIAISALSFDEQDKAFKVSEDTEVKFIKNEDDIFFSDARCQKSAKSIIVSKDTDNGQFYFSTKKAGNIAIHMSISGIGNLENTIKIAAAPAKEMTFLSIPNQEKSGLSISQPIVVSPVDEFGNAADLSEKVKLSFFTDSDCATPIHGKVKGELTQDIKKGQAVFAGLVFDVEGYVFAKAEVKGMSPVCSGYMSFDK